MRVYLECINDRHYKFWEAIVEPDSDILQTRWGRIGTSGQRKSYILASPSRALLELGDRAAEKIRKGYREISRTLDPTPAPEPDPAPANRGNSRGNPNRFLSL